MINVQSDRTVTGYTNIFGWLDKYAVVYAHQRFLFFTIYTVVHMFNLGELVYSTLAIFGLIVVYNVISLYIFKKYTKHETMMLQSEKALDIQAKLVRIWLTTFSLIAIATLRIRLVIFETEVTNTAVIMANYFGLLILSLLCVVRIAYYGRVKRLIVEGALHEKQNIGTKGKRKTRN